MRLRKLTRFFVASLCALAICLPDGEASAEAVPFAQGPVVALDVSFPPENVGSLFSGTLVWAFNRDLPFHGSALPQTSRILIDEINVTSPGRYAIDIADGSGRIVETLEYADLAGRTQIWSKVMSGGAVSVRVRGEDAAERLSFRLTSIAYDFQAVAEKSLVGLINGLTDVALYSGPMQSEVALRAPSIAKLDFVRDGSKFTCSGFLVDTQTFLTNAHCIDSQAICDTAIAVFGFEKLSHGGVSLGQQYRCREFIAADPVLDAAAITLADAPGEDDVARMALPFSNRAVEINEPLLLIQHPGGALKMVSVEECKASTVPQAASSNGATGNLDFQHGCDTEQGSSGSPVLRADGTIVGLHKIGHGADPDSGLFNTAVDARAVMAWLETARSLTPETNSEAVLATSSQNAPSAPVSREAPGSTSENSAQNCEDVNRDNCPEQFEVPEDRRNAQPLPMPAADENETNEVEGGEQAGEESVSEPGSQGSGTTE